MMLMEEHRQKDRWLWK